MMGNSQVQRLRAGGAAFIGVVLLTVSVLLLPIYIIAFPEGVSSQVMEIPFTDFLAGFLPEFMQTGLMNYIAWSMPITVGVGLVVGVLSLFGGVDKPTARMLLLLTTPALVTLVDFLIQSVDSGVAVGELRLAYGYWVLAVGWMLVVYACAQYARDDSGAEKKKRISS